MKGTIMLYSLGPTVAMFNFNMPELIVLALLGIVLFGRRLPEIGKNVGKTIVEFKKGLNSASEELNKSVAEEPETKKPALPETRYEANKANPYRQTKQIAAGGDEP